MLRDRGANERVAGRTGAAVAVRRSNVCRHGDVRERSDAIVLLSWRGNLRSRMVVLLLSY